MANWQGAARSNYVTIIDMGGLTKTLALFSGITVSAGEGGNEGKHCLLATDTEYGDWPSSAYSPQADDPDGDEVEIDFNAAEHIMPFVAEGEVLVIMEAGAENLRYITGCASAFVRRVAGVEEVSIDLRDIYSIAADKLGVKQSDISHANY